MKNIFLVLFLLPCMLFAQKTHTVAAKESIFSIGRMYNVHPRELAAYNNISMESGLTIGQVLKIPAKTTMQPLPPAGTVPVTTTAPPPVVEKPTPSASTGKVPVYYKVGKKETLYGISVKHNKVPIADLKKWNKLTGDGVTEGMNLIVGFTNAPASNAVAKTETKEIPRDVQADPKAAATDPVKKPAVDNPKAPEIRNVISNPETNTKPSAGSAFKSQFAAQASTGATERGMAGSFKSTSGWEDGKYYCLHNTAPRGSIVKITSTATGKTVYAKVLDAIPDLKQNSGLMLRISNAAASALGITADTFECEISY